MRPCGNCGAPIENSVELCDECAKLDLPSEAERAASFNRDYRQRRRDVASSESTLDSDDVGQEVEKVKQRFLAAVIALPAVLLLPIAILAGVEYGITGFF
jgi:hypothetical protein